jgi:hypothetical protein
MDPGLKNAAFTWVGFDADNRAYVFDEVLLQEKTPTRLREGFPKGRMRSGESRTRSTSSTLLRATDPSLTPSLSKHILQSLKASSRCTATTPSRLASSRSASGWRRACSTCLPLAAGLARRGGGVPHGRTDPDGEFKVVKENDHRSTALRYAWHYATLGPSTGWTRPNGSTARLGPREGPVSSTTRGCVRQTGPQEVSPLGSMS